MKVQAPEQSIELITANGAAELGAWIQGRLGRRVWGFRLVVTGKGLVLKGHSHTYYAKQLAQHAVMEAMGVPILANEIEVS